MVNLNDITSGVRMRLGADGIPSFLSDGSISDLANDRINNLNEAYQVSIDSGNIATKWIAPLRDLTTADVIAARNNTDVDTQISVGNINLNYSNKQTANQWQVDYWLKKAQDVLKAQGIRITFNYTTKAD